MGAQGERQADRIHDLSAPESDIFIKYNRDREHFRGVLVSKRIGARSIRAWLPAHAVVLHPKVSSWERDSKADGALWR